MSRRNKLLDCKSSWGGSKYSLFCPLYHFPRKIINVWQASCVSSAVPVLRVCCISELKFQTGNPERCWAAAGAAPDAGPGRRNLKNSLMKKFRRLWAYLWVGDTGCNLGFISRAKLPEWFYRAWESPARSLLWPEGKGRKVKWFRKQLVCRLCLFCHFCLC